MYYWDKIMLDIVDEGFPQKKKRVRDKDTPYMNTAWKNAIREKRRAFKKYLNESEMWQWAGAVRQRRIALRQYWKRKPSDPKENPRNFSETF